VAVRKGRLFAVVVHSVGRARQKPCLVALGD
jgi:hypothetical protein